MRGITWLAEDLSASQEGLCSLELFAAVSKFKECVTEQWHCMDNDDDNNNIIKIICKIKDNNFTQKNYGDPLTRADHFG